MFFYWLEENIGTVGIVLSCSDKRAPDEGTRLGFLEPQQSGVHTQASTADLTLGRDRLETPVQT